MQRLVTPEPQEQTSRGQNIELQLPVSVGEDIKFIVNADVHVSRTCELQC